MTRLETAADLYADGRYQEALDSAGRTKNLYAGLFARIRGAKDMPNIAKKAAALIRRIESDPQAQSAFQEANAAKRYRRVLRLERKAKEDASLYFDLYQTLRTIVKRYPNCPTGRKCKDRLRAIEADRKLFRLIKKEERRRTIAAALRRAEEYKSDGQPDQAGAEYAKLKDKYPGKTLKQLRRMAKKRSERPTPPPLAGSARGKSGQLPESQES